MGITAPITFSTRPNEKYDAHRIQRRPEGRLTAGIFAVIALIGDSRSSRPCLSALLMTHHLLAVIIQEMAACSGCVRIEVLPGSGIARLSLVCSHRGITPNESLNDSSPWLWHPASHLLAHTILVLRQEQLGGDVPT